MASFPSAWQIVDDILHYNLDGLSGHICLRQGVDSQIHKIWYGNRSKVPVATRDLKQKKKQKGKGTSNTEKGP